MKRCGAIAVEGKQDMRLFLTSPNTAAEPVVTVVQMKAPVEMAAVVEVEVLEAVGMWQPLLEPAGPLPSYHIWAQGELDKIYWFHFLGLWLEVWMT